MISSKQFEIPCLHRVHQGTPQGVHKISHSIGMSIELKELIARLEKLNREAIIEGREDRSILVTFDDGWIDSLLLIDFFDRAKKLQPVLFLTHQQLTGDSRLLPLSRLYAWCDHWSLDLDCIKELGISRSVLKSIPEDLQHSILDSLEIPGSYNSSQVLELATITELRDRGWIIGSHAHDHHDLRNTDLRELELGLEKAYDSTIKAGGLPWLAWPEGRCSQEICEIASKVGFEKQFSLNIESGKINFPGLEHREIWSE